MENMKFQNLNFTFERILENSFLLKLSSKRSEKGKYERRCVFLYKIRKQPEKSIKNVDLRNSMNVGNYRFWRDVNLAGCILSPLKY